MLRNRLESSNFIDSQASSQERRDDKSQALSLHEIAYEDCLKPSASALIEQPWNAIANAANGAGHLVVNRDILPRMPKIEVRESEYMGPSWWLQNVSTGLALGVVYAVAGRGANAVLRAGTKTLGVEGAIAGAAAHRSTGQILGAAAFDAARDKIAGETRIGNAAGGMVGLAVFEAGNSIGHSFGGLGSIATRIATGALGATSQLVTSRAVSNSDTPNTRELLQNGVTGGAMNLVLPVMQRRLFSGGLAKTAGDDLKARTVAAPAEIQSGITKNSAGKAAVRLIHEGREVMTFVVGAKEHGPFISAEDYQQRGQRITNPEVAIFSIEGFPETKLVFEGSQLNERRKIRSGQTLSPEQAGSMVSALPDPRLVKRLIVLNHDHPIQPWMQQQTSRPDARIYGETFANGDVYLYKPANDLNTKATVEHEWFHLLRINSTKASAMFDSVGDHEPIRLGVPSEPISGNSEVWSVLGQRLIGSDVHTARIVAQANPVRSTILAKALKESLEGLPANQQSHRQQQHMDVVRYIEQSVKPGATAKLSKLVSAGARVHEALSYITLP